MAQLDRLPHPVAAQVEVAVAAGAFPRSTSPEKDSISNGGVSASERSSGVGHPDLDLAGGQLVVDGLRRALDDRPAGAEHVLGAQLVAELERLARLVGIEDELDEPGAVAEVDEDEAAVVAAAVDPARDADLGVDPVRQDLPAPGVAVAVRPQRWEPVAHGDESVSTSVAGSTSRSSPELMSRSLAFAVAGEDQRVARADAVGLLHLALDARGRRDRDRPRSRRGEAP